MLAFFALLLLVDATTFALKDLTNNVEERTEDGDAAADEASRVVERIRSEGFTCETHLITTADGYINTLHRIPNPGGRPVFLQHGLLADASNFVVVGNDSSLGFALAKSGYDVWLGNFRGNTYSRRHQSLTTDDADYWDFSMDEMAKYDLPAAIDHILKTSKQSKIIYIGHSMGTMTFWMATDLDPSINEKVDLMIAMAPVAKVANINPYLRELAKSTSAIKDQLDDLGIYNVPPASEDGDTFTSLKKTLCKFLERARCDNLLYAVFGFDRETADNTIMNYIINNMPGGASIKTLQHFGQLVVSGKFAEFHNRNFWNTGLLCYLWTCKTIKEYQLDNVNTRVILVWSQQDWLADPEDVKFLSDGLPNRLSEEDIVFEDFNHLDFIFARGETLKSRIVAPIMERITRLSPLTEKIGKGDKVTSASKAVTSVSKAVTSVSKAVTSVSKAATSKSKAVTSKSKAVTSKSKAVTSASKAGVTATGTDDEAKIWKKVEELDKSLSKRLTVPLATRPEIWKKLNELHKRLLAEELNGLKKPTVADRMKQVKRPSTLLEKIGKSDEVPSAFKAVTSAIEAGVTATGTDEAKIWKKVEELDKSLSKGLTVPLVTRPDAWKRVNELHKSLLAEKFAIQNANEVGVEPWKP